MSHHSDLEVAEKLRELFQSEMVSLKYICANSGLEFHQVNQIMRDGTLEIIEPEQKERLIIFLYGTQSKTGI